MPNANRKIGKDPRIAQKAQMLITILGNDFTRKSSHPFFRSLTEAAAQPSSTGGKPQDVSRALKNLMTQLAKQTEKSVKPHAPKVRKQTIPSEQYLSPSQHPALIASAVSKLEAVKRREVLKSLEGKLAYRVMLYVREIDEKARARHA